MDEKTFYEGQIFSCREELLSFFREFCRVHSQRLTIRDSSEEKIIFKCCHGRKRKSTCTGQRPNQHYLFKNCMAQVNVRKTKQNYWQVTKADLEHNHEIGWVQCDMNGRKEKLKNGYKVVFDLVRSEVKDSINTNILKKKNNKFLTQKDIQNIKNKLFSLSTKEKERELKNFLLNVADENGRCMIRHGNDGTVEALFIATGVMIDCLKKSQPQVIQIDISLEFDVESYKVLSFCYFSSVTGNSEFAALAFLSKETLGIIKECLEKFKQICIIDPAAFLINKDFMAISMIRDVFPLSKILWCKFSVLKSIKKFLSSVVACCSATKENLFKMFKEVLNSQTEEEYDERKLDLLTIAMELEVKTGDKCVPFKDQFCNDWDLCREMWVDCYRKNLLLMKDSTIDRMERSLWVLKNYISTNFPGTLSVCECIVGLADFVSQRLSNSVSSTTQEVFKIINKNPKIRILLDSASLKLNGAGLKLLHESIVSLEALKSAKPGSKKKILENCDSYMTTIKSCSCEFWKSNKAPCQHILFLRELLKIESGLENCFHERYLAAEDTQDDFELMEEMSEEDSDVGNVNIFEDMGSDDKMKTLPNKEMFKKLSAVTREINELLCAQDTEKFLEYIEELKNFGKFVRQGVTVAVISQSAQSSKSTKKSVSHEMSVLDGSQNFLKSPDKIKLKGRLSIKSTS